jgi:hypothetical protein
LDVLTFGCPPAHGSCFDFFSLALHLLMADALSMFGFLFQIRSVEAVHRFFEKFPEAFMDKLHVPVPKRFSMFL